MSACPNQHIMISEGSCDTEDWSNDAENSASITGIHLITKYIQIENSYFKLIFPNITIWRALFQNAINPFE